jgi:hypothetical protein
MTHTVNIFLEREKITETEFLKPETATELTA